MIHNTSLYTNPDNIQKFLLQVWYRIMINYSKLLNSKLQRLLWILHFLPKMELDQSQSHNDQAVWGFGCWVSYYGYWVGRWSNSLSPSGSHLLLHCSSSLISIQKVHDKMVAMQFCLPLDFATFSSDLLDESTLCSLGPFSWHHSRSVVCTSPSVSAWHQCSCDC